MLKTGRARVAIIGLGSIAAKVYLPELTQRQDVEVVALCSRRRETVENYGGLYRIDQQFTALDEVLSLRSDLAAQGLTRELVEFETWMLIPAIVNERGRRH